MERRERTFPIRFIFTKPTRFHPGGSQMFFDHEWKAYQKSLNPDQPTNDPLAAPPDTTTAEPAPEPAAIAPDANPEAIAATPHDSSTRSISSTHESVSPLLSSTSFTSSTSSGAPRPPDFYRHSRRCTICSHPDRDAIEGDFIRWRSPELIATQYKIADRVSIYRHAHSTGLFAWRRQELGRVLEGILESAEHLKLESSDVIIRAARIYSHLDSNGYWFEPPRTTFLFTGPAPAIQPPDDLSQSNAPSRAQKLPAPNAGHSKTASHPRRPKNPTGEQKANRNSRPIRKSINSNKPKEKANS